MKLQPSRIHYSQNLLLNQPSTFSIFAGSKCHNGSTVNKIGGNFPKLQVFKKDGCYFALDNNSLSFYRQMELSKQNIENYTIDVVLVPSKKIPKPILDASACSAEEGSSSSGTESGRGTVGDYCITIISLVNHWANGTWGRKFCHVQTLINERTLSVIGFVAVPNWTVVVWELFLLFYISIFLDSDSDSDDVPRDSDHESSFST